MVSEQYKRYVENFSRVNGNGDLFNPIREIFRTRSDWVLPIDFFLVGYLNDSGDYIESLGIPGLRIMCRRDSAMWNGFCSYTERQLNTIINYLNNSYGLPTKDRLNFSSRKFVMHTVKITDILDSCCLELPGDEVVDLSSKIDSITVRIIPRLSHPSKFNVEQGFYHANGVLDIYQSPVLRGDILAHEIGHGIFGYDHHEIKGCLMDSTSNKNEPNISFCEEDQKVLARLIS
ncbi:hypothetical protein J4230_00605 [Candidatus Woesearchaeota archaeon]|nr:hypothetical protein [Candidatus Woesearchaeota archaeon]